MYSELAYTRRGSGEPLVLIHGIGHRRQAWDPVLDLLATSYDVFAVDLAGFGESPGHPDGVSCSMQNACRNLVDNFSLWGIEKPHVVGNSLGGAIALELAARDQVRSATALSPAGFFRGADRLVALLVLLALKLTSYLPRAVVAPAMRSATMRRVLGRWLFEHGDRLTAEEFLGDAAALRDGTGRASSPCSAWARHMPFVPLSRCPRPWPGAPATRSFSTASRVWPPSVSHRPTTLRCPAADTSR